MTITRVQGPAKSIANSGTTLIVTLSSTPTVSNTLICASGVFLCGSITSISQTGVTWTRAVNNDNGCNLSELWYGNVTSSAGTTVTITFSDTIRGYAIADICEYNATLTVDQIPPFLSNGCSTSTSTGTTATTTAAEEVWAGVAFTITSGGSYNTQTNPTNGFTLCDGVEHYSSPYHTSLAYLEKIVSTTGAASSGTTVNQIANWTSGIATFKAVTPVTYNITASADANSTISPSGSVQVQAGQNQSFSFSANTGYHKTHVYVDSVDQGAITSYTFNTVNTTHTISVTSAQNGSDDTTLTGNLTVNLNATVIGTLNTSGLKLNGNAGTSDQVLTSNGPGNLPAWKNVAAITSQWTAGTVTVLDPNYFKIVNYAPNTISRTGYNRFTQSGSMSLSGTLGFTPTAGRKLIMTHVCDGSDINTISQTGVTWTRIQSYFLGTATPTIMAEMWIGDVGSGAATNFTITYKTYNGYYTQCKSLCDIMEYAGLDASPVERYTNDIFFSGSPTTTGELYTTNANDLLIGMICMSSTVTQTSPQNGFTLISGAYANGESLATLQLMATVTGTYSTGTSTNGGSYVGLITAFKAAAQNTQQKLTMVGSTGGGTGASYSAAQPLTLTGNVFGFNDTCDLKVNTVTGTAGLKLGTWGSQEFAITQDGSYVYLNANAAKDIYLGTLSGHAVRIQRNLEICGSLIYNNESTVTHLNADMLDGHHWSEISGGGGSSFNQNLNTTDSPTFAGLTTTGNTTIGGNLTLGHNKKLTDAVDVQSAPGITGQVLTVNASGYPVWAAPTGGSGGSSYNQNLNTYNSPTFAGLTLNSVITSNASGSYPQPHSNAGMIFDFYSANHSEGIGIQPGGPWIKYGTNFNIYHDSGTSPVLSAVSIDENRHVTIGGNLSTSGNVSVNGILSMSCTSPYFSWNDLQPYLWGLQWINNQWVWTPTSNELVLQSPFIHYNDSSLQSTNQSLDIGVIRTATRPDELTLWISRHLIVKKDFACGGVANIAQGALVLGSDWDANNPTAQMPQIYLAHSEGGDYPAEGNYPTNPRRDILQIWRDRHLGFAKLQCGNIFIQMGNDPTLDLKNSNGELKVTLKFDGTNGLLYTSAGDLVFAANSNNIRPLSNNSYLLGDESFKWKEIWAVNTHFGDAIFSNGWRLTEDGNSGVLLLRADGSVAQRWV